jgi:beta-glucosidase
MDVQNLINQMTLQEKASLCSGLNFWYLKGIERLGIPSIMVTDGPHGLRKQAGDGDHLGLNESVPATCFPTASALAATWNRDLVYQVGEALGEECRQEKVGVILGPGANIKRSPLCGRNFEYFSEDPYLTGEIAKSHINGVQSQGIGTSLKHFAVNNQEFRRMTIDAIVDERALREIYLTGFEIAVKAAQPWTVMCAYNRLNGTYCCEHESLLTDILKKEWGHEGLVVTDWGAMNDRVAALAAGLELEMPGTKSGNDQKIVTAVESGQLAEEVLDQAVERILNMIFKAQETLAEEYTFNPDAHHALARRVAGEGAVLLKNEDGILPLKKAARVAILGQFAKTPRYQGAGSSLMNPSRLDNVYDEVLKLVGEAQISFAPGYSESGVEADDALIQEAIDVAMSADVVVICGGLTDMFEVEGLDRDHMKLPPGHDALITAVAEVHSQVIVVLSNGSPVEMPWVDDVQGILEGYLGGQAGAGAVADILYGVVNPSGKLAETFPIKIQDNPSYHNFPGGPQIVEYRESIYVGYRYYDSVANEILFPFGYGLSYTTFEYNDLELSQDRITDGETLTVSLNVMNTGAVPGSEIVQLYVRDVESTAFRPIHELKGFAKVKLEPGEVTNVTLSLDRRAFAYYDTNVKDWHVESGEFEIRIGASSRDIHLTGVVQVESASPKTLAPDRDALELYYDFPVSSPVSKANFEKLYGRAIPENEVAVKGAFTLNTPISDMRGSFIGRQFGHMMERQIRGMIGDDLESPTAMLLMAIVKETPLRTMMMFGEGVSREMLDALLMMINGKVFRGLGALIKAVRANKN